MGRRTLRAAAVTAVVSLVSIGLGLDAGAQDEPPDLDATALTPSGRVTAGKSATSRIAQSDPALLGRTDVTPVAVMIKLDYDSVATYDGGVAGFAATSPAVTGRELTGRSAAERRYAGYIARQERAFAADLAESVPAAELGVSLRTVYGGVAATIPANEVDDVLALPNVVAVQRDAVNQLLTDASTTFIGADTVYSQLGGDTNAGEGVIFGVLDTGAWPEHPSFAHEGNLDPPPAKADGTARTCDFGDNPLTPATDVFECNNKLIGGEAFLDTYLANNPPETYLTARDSDGHGTHTGSTAAGNVLDSAPVFGVERGPIRGVAPGAWVSVYKVCGVNGCYSSDSALAVEQAILDGVEVINFSISGGTNPATDPVELAFLDAYAAGVFVAASAGNEGPGAGTVNHLSPWVTTVAASTQEREFVSTLTVTGAGGATATFTGASITDGAGPLPIVAASAAPYSNARCLAPAPAGTFTGKIVACERGTNARVEKGYNVLQGGAAGMVLYNPALADIETDNHWLPTVHLADGADFVAFMSANPGATAEFTAGERAEGQSDVMAAFSSRGPGGTVIKPDVTAPGVQILAGHTPTPDGVVGGPSGEYFQAIAGTSMSSPHVAGSALLLTALHPDWTPGQIKSALMTTSTTSVVKEDLTTPADPFDLGAGRIDLSVAGTAGLTFDASAAELLTLGLDPLTAGHANLPSLNLPVLPGRFTTTRVATSTTGKRQTYTVEVTSPEGSTISVSPKRFSVAPGASQELTITVETTAATGQYFGEIRLLPRAKPGRLAALHLPVAFVPQQGDVDLSQSCGGDIRVRERTECTVTAQNSSFQDTTVDLTTTVNNKVGIVSADGATVTPSGVQASGELAGALAGVPSLAPGELFGYLPLEDFGVDPDPIGDEEIVNYDVPPFVYNGKTYDVLGVDSNGYVIAGGGTSEDNECCNLPASIPDPARPNDFLAPFWTDLDGTGADGIRVTVLRSGTDRWLAIEYQVNVWGTTSLRTFQIWIGLNGTQDITFAYDPERLPAAPGRQPFLVGVENETGIGGDQLPPGTLPTEDLRVTSTDPTPGDSLSYTVVLQGARKGEAVVTTEMTSPAVPGVTVVTSTFQVLRRR